MDGWMQLLCGAPHHSCLSERYHHSLTHSSNHSHIAHCRSECMASMAETRCPSTSSTASGWTTSPAVPTASRSLRLRQLSRIYGAPAVRDTLMLPLQCCAMMCCVVDDIIMHWSYCRSSPGPEVPAVGGRGRVLRRGPTPPLVRQLISSHLMREEEGGRVHPICSHKYTHCNAEACMNLLRIYDVFLHY